MSLITNVTKDDLNTATADHDADIRISDNKEDIWLAGWGEG